MQRFAEGPNGLLEVGGLDVSETEPARALVRQVRVENASGQEEHVGPALLEQRLVLFDGARIAVEVLALPELERIHEDAGDDDVRRGAGCIDQGEVSLVQGSHRGHEPDGA